jgi:hypothetical protein
MMYPSSRIPLSSHMKRHIRQLATFLNAPCDCNRFTVLQQVRHTQHTHTHT